VSSRLSTTARYSPLTMSITPNSSAPLMLLPSRTTVHDRGAHHHFPLSIDRANAAPRTPSLIARDKQCRDRRCHSALRHPLPDHCRPYVGSSTLYLDCARRCWVPPPLQSLGPQPRSTPIGRTGQRGLVQSGFNDVPHRAAPLISSRDLVDPSSIPVEDDRALRWK